MHFAAFLNSLLRYGLLWPATERFPLYMRRLIDEVSARKKITMVSGSAFRTIVASLGDSAASNFAEAPVAGLSGRG